MPFYVHATSFGELLTTHQQSVMCCLYWTECENTFNVRWENTFIPARVQQTFFLAEGGSFERSRASMLRVLWRCRTCSHSVSSKPTAHTQTHFNYNYCPI